MVQWYAATGRYSFILWVSAAALLLKVILNLILTPLIGLSGIMLGTALMYALTTSLLLIGSNRPRSALQRARRTAGLKCPAIQPIKKSDQGAPPAKGRPRPG